MDSNSIYTKTAKGLREVTGKTSDLSRNLRNILKKIDGKMTAGELLINFDDSSEGKLQEALLTLVNGDYIREFIHAESIQPQQRKVTAKKVEEKVQEESLDFTYKAKPASKMDFSRRQRSKVDRKSVV